MMLNKLVSTFFKDGSGSRPKLARIRNTGLLTGRTGEHALRIEAGTTGVKAVKATEL
jgi:hypothetical protein